jgi:hypothetical protein
MTLFWFMLKKKIKIDLRNINNLRGDLLRLLLLRRIIRMFNIKLILLSIP